MFRSASSVFLTCCVMLLSMACGPEEQAKQPDPRDAKLEEIQTRITELERREIALSTTLVEARSQLRAGQASMEKSLSAIQAGLDSLAGEGGLVQAPLESPKKTESSPAAAAATEDSGGWSWWIKALLVAAIVVIFFAVYNHLIREEDFDEEDFADGEFLEENELGTVRYPGASGKGGGDSSDGRD